MKILSVPKLYNTVFNTAGYTKPLCFTSTIPNDTFEKQQVDAVKNDIELDESGKQILDINNCFAKLKYCSKDMEWAKKMNDEIYLLSSMIDDGASFEELIEQAEKDVSKIQSNSDWGKKSQNGAAYILNDKVRGYEEYFERYNDLVDSSVEKFYRPKANGWHRHANTVLMHKDPNYDNVVIIDYGFKPSNMFSNINLAACEYDDLMEMTPPFALDEILKSVATIRWLIAQETPYERGSNSIGNLITRAILHHFNVYQTPKKEGIGMDFEAFYRDLDDYIEAYPTFFEKRPFMIET